MADLALEQAADIVGIHKLLNGEAFSMLKEAQVLIEEWRAVTKIVCDHTRRWDTDHPINRIGELAPWHLRR